jgi:hypothetical protein
MHHSLGAETVCNYFHTYVWLKVCSMFIAWLKREGKATVLEEHPKILVATLFKLCGRIC